ncbi:EAL and HDOD domain-containing protein [Bacillus sp. 2205SS5-2]|uniref:EAL and HDOD domain-containing protein n=1 Tax=Bacillus sp. 2205SS5-2 TaxID=3109031 RepID=UPI00300771DE
MEVFVARQPIFDIYEKCVAYELLYRHSSVNSFDHSNGDIATAEVLVNSFLTIGIEQVTNGKPYYINFTEGMLSDDITNHFPKTLLVVEILEEVLPTNELIQKVKNIKSLGYQVAIDDFVLDTKNPFSVELLRSATIVKVDFMNSTLQNRKNIETLAKAFKVKLLAEKVETREQYQEAKMKGYEYFQGYFFSRPKIISSHDVPIYFHSYIEVIRQLSTSDPDVRKIASFIEKDLSLSYKLLKLINSFTYRTSQPIKSIQQGIVLIGLNEVQKWIYILAVREQWGSTQSLSKEVMRLCLIRGKLCEYIGKHQLGVKESSTYFLLGMFSLMETILQRSMEVILKDLPLDKKMKDALMGTENELKETLEAVIALEKGNWKVMDRFIEGKHITPHMLIPWYEGAREWSENLLENEIIGI